MPAIIFLVSSFLCGFGIAGKIPVGRKAENTIWCRLAMAVGIGYLISGWTAYLVSYTAKVMFGMRYPKIYGNAVAIVVTCFIAFVTIKGKRHTEDKSGIQNKRLFAREGLLLGALFGFILWTMFYVFHIDTENGKEILKSGVTVFSDYSPHTAMIRSFSFHDNFPTQYPHYGGQDVKYHFMFQFLAGNLEYLGMRIDWAFNLISAASLWGFLVLLFYFTQELAESTAAGILTVLMFFCRSSIAVFDKFIQSIANGGWRDFLHNTSFIGYTAHEDWGLWNYNVFLNQRHLGFGLLIAIIPIMYFSGRLDWLDKKNEISEKKSAVSQSRVAVVIKTTWLSKQAWVLSPDWPIAAAFGVMLGALAFWNGAVVVAALLILAGFAVMSSNKFDYVIMAVNAIALSFAQKKFFMPVGIASSMKDEMKTRFYFGFLADKQTAGGVISYLIMLSGVFFLGVAVFLIVFKGKKRAMIAAFLLPVIFAFTVSMTPDIAVNHKYIIISTIFLNMMWAYALTRLWKSRNVFLRTLAVLLAITLTATGAYDLLTIYNADKRALKIDMGSSLTEWLKENVKENDLVLTGEESMSEITLSGIMLYNGWPYYAWSAGYDTDTRAANAIEIYSSKDKEKVKELVKKEGIDYIIYEDGMTYEEHECSDEVIKKIYKCVFEEGKTRVYKVA